MGILHQRGLLEKELAQYSTEKVALRRIEIEKM